jgi:hypothetical protein
VVLVAPPELVDVVVPIGLLMPPDVLVVCVPPEVEPPEVELELELVPWPEPLGAVLPLDDELVLVELLWLWAGHCRLRRHRRQPSRRAWRHSRCGQCHWAGSRPRAFARTVHRFARPPRGAAAPPSPPAPPPAFILRAAS